MIQEWLGELEVRVVGADDDAADDAALFQDVQVAVGGAGRQVGVGCDDVRQRDRATGTGDGFDQASSSGGVTVFSAVEARRDLRVEFGEIVAVRGRMLVVVHGRGNQPTAPATGVRRTARYATADAGIGSQ